MSNSTGVLEQPSAAGAVADNTLSLAERLAIAVRRLWNGYWSDRLARAAVLMLHALDDRQLEDIGVARGEIETLVYGGPMEGARPIDGLLPLRDVVAGRKYRARIWRLPAAISG